MFLMNPYIVLTNELAREICIRNENVKDLVIKERKKNRSRKLVILSIFYIEQQSHSPRKGKI